MSTISRRLQSLSQSNNCVHQLLQSHVKQQQLKYASFLSHDRVEFRQVSSNTSSERERARTIAAYYNQPSVDKAACKVKQYL